MSPHRLRPSDLVCHQGDEPALRFVLALGTLTPAQWIAILRGVHRLDHDALDECGHRVRALLPIAGQEDAALGLAVEVFDAATRVAWPSHLTQAVRGHLSLLAGSLAYQAAEALLVVDVATPETVRCRYAPFEPVLPLASLGIV